METPRPLSRLARLQVEAWEPHRKQALLVIPKPPPQGAPWSMSPRFLKFLGRETG